MPSEIRCLGVSVSRALVGSGGGVITFPSQLVPSMTAYAAELDTSRVHSVLLVRGAYTQYSLRQPHDVEVKCEDHALVPVAVSAKAPHLSAGAER